MDPTTKPVRRKADGANGHAHAPKREPVSDLDDILDRRRLLAALTAFKKGDFSVRLPMHLDGIDGKIADAFNDVLETSQKFATELDRISRVVGKDGRIEERMSIGEVRGAWAGEVHSLNTLVSDLVQPTSEMARVIGAVAKGDLSQIMAEELGGRPLKGEFLRTAKTVNTMVDQLSSFALRSRVTRSRHRGQARWTGRRARRRRNVEGPHRFRQSDGVEPHGSGAKHRRGDHRGSRTATCRRKLRSTLKAKFLN